MGVDGSLVDPRLSARSALSAFYDAGRAAPLPGRWDAGRVCGARTRRRTGGMVRPAPLSRSIGREDGAMAGAVAPAGAVPGCGLAGRGPARPDIHVWMRIGAGRMLGKSLGLWRA